MKTYVYTCLALLCLYSSTYAQITRELLASSDSIKINYENAMNDMFNGVDLSEVPSGFLYERGIPFIDLDPYTGESASIKSNLVVFSLAYASLTTMTVDSLSALPPPSSYRDKMDTTDAQSSVLLLAGLHQEYHSIDSLAIDSNLFTHTGLNLYDVLGRPYSPYVQKEIFVFAPSERIIDNASFNIHFDSELFYTNTSKTIDSLSLDLGDGMGYQEVSFNQNIPVSFSTGGQKTLVVKLKYTDGSVYYSNFDISVSSPNRAPEETPDIVKYFASTWGAVPADSSGGGTINVYLACGHERIEKPFIWAEAYNPLINKIPANLTPKDIQDRIDHEQTTLGDQSMWDYLTENGYDIIILDYDDGADYLPRTAEFIKKAIRWVNIQKHSAGSNAKNIILGQSMGGVATALALKEMEVLTSEDHEVEQFIVFDSPLMGVNIPLSAQACLLDMSFMWIDNPLPWETDMFLFEYVELIEEVVDILYLPATRTMVSLTCQNINVAGTTYNIPNVLDVIFGKDTEHLYDDFYHYLHDEDELGGLPEDCEIITITNGSRFGELGQQPFDAGDLVVHSENDNFTVASLIGGWLDGYADSLFGGGENVFDAENMAGNVALIMWQAGTEVNTDTRLYAVEDSPGFTYFKNDITMGFSWAPDTIINHHNSVEVLPYHAVEIDNAPGGFFGIKNQGVILNPDALGSLMPSVFKMQTWCFTPTGSVLNYHGPAGETWMDEPLRDYSDLSATLDEGYLRGIKSYMSNSEEPTFGTPDSYKNTAHTWFTNESSTFMYYQLVGSNELDGISTLGVGTTFNYGTSALTDDTDFETSLPVRTSSVLDHSLSVENTSLSVNANSIIGLTPSPYSPDVLGNAKDASHFVMHIGELCDPDPAVVLTIDNGSDLTIGDGSGRTGSVLVQDGHSIYVKNGGVLRIKSGSTLKLNSGGEIVVANGGKVVIENGGHLITEYGSEFDYYSGAQLELNGADSRLILGGTLHLHENAQFKPTHDGVSSGMIVINNISGTLEAETGSSFDIVGDGDDDPLLLINEGGSLWSTAYMDVMRFTSCKVLIRNGGFPILSISPFTSIDVTYDVQSNLVDADVHPSLMVYNKSLITSSSFQDVNLKGIRFEPLSGGYFINMINTDFDYSYAKNDDQIIIEAGSISFFNCNFDGFQGRGLVLEGQTSYSQIQNCNFTAGDYYPYSVAITQNAETELFVKNCTFDLHKTAIEKKYGKLRLKCNDFSNSFGDCIIAGTHTELEMSTNAGYNVFSALNEYNVKLSDAQSMHINGGYNDFHDQTSHATFRGDIQIDGPYYAMMLAQRNKWNPANSTPPSTEFDLWSSITGAPISVSAISPQTAICGAEDPSDPVVDYSGSTGNYFPNIPISGQSHNMRLDSAVIFAGASTKQWDSNESDLVAIDRFYDILTYQYTVQELADTATRFYIDCAYNWMKHTVNHALTDSTILASYNQNVFSTPVQKYINVLNELTNEDTIIGSDYVRRFYLELDKAHIFRALGHTDMGLDILKNVNLCALDSNEQSATNQWLFAFEEELAWQHVGDSLFGIDTVLTDTTSYAQAVNNQITETYFGSVINSISSITYRSCSGAKQPEPIETRNNAYPFSLYPNPTNGHIFIEYDVPENSNSILMMYSIDGKEIGQFNLRDGRCTENIDISFVENGVYLYRVIVSGLPIVQGRVVVAQ